MYRIEERKVLIHGFCQQIDSLIRRVFGHDQEVGLSNSIDVCFLSWVGTFGDHIACPYGVRCLNLLHICIREL